MCYAHCRVLNVMTHRFDALLVGKKQFGVSIDEDLVERLHDRLNYTDDRSEWIEEAIRMRLEQEREGEE